jgi:probable rRNA maturation factor
MSFYDIEVLPRVAESEAWQQLVGEAASATLADQEYDPPVSITILLTSDEHVQTLNRDYLGFDMPTDVLSFPAGEPINGALSYLGDVAISVPAAERQAETGGHSIGAELQLLTVHAVLHLLGYDHAEDAEKSEMWMAQARILENLGAEIRGPKPA